MTIDQLMRQFEEAKRKLDPLVMGEGCYLYWITSQEEATKLGGFEGDGFGYMGNNKFFLRSGMTGGEVSAAPKMALEIAKQYKSKKINLEDALRFVTEKMQEAYSQLLKT